MKKRVFVESKISGKGNFFLRETGKGEFKVAKDF